MKRLLFGLMAAMMLMTACQTGDGVTATTEPGTEKSSAATTAAETTTEMTTVQETTADSTSVKSTTLESTSESTITETATTVTETESTTVETTEATSSDAADKTSEAEELTTTSSQSPYNQTLPVFEGDMSALNEQRLQYDEIKALWITYLDLKKIFEGGGADHFRNEIRTMVTNTKSLGLNTIMLQVRPFGDALYPSAIYPFSYIITGVEGEGLSYDPLAIAIEEAHAQGIRLEAWINPYRIRSASSTVPFSEDNIASLWIEDGSRRVLQTKNGTIVYNPGMSEVRERIVAGVGELIHQYPVDGIHFDDYFYPTTDLSFDEPEYLNFLHDNDALSQEDWRRYNVNTLIADVYKTIQSSEADVIFGISPQASPDTNYNQLYADVTLWMTEPGYVDYLMPQIYYGFNHDKLPFEQTLNQWYNLSKGQVAVIPGIAVYKIGKEDAWAGSGSQEWITDIGILAEMIQTAKFSQAYDGYALFRYDFLFNPEEEVAERMAEELKILGETE